jgi:hypothetical protein
LQTRRSALVKEVCIGDALLNSLYERGCLSHEHVAAVKKGGIKSKQIRRLLDIMESRSAGHYKAFLEALKETKQDHVIIVLNKVDNIGDVDAIAGELGPPIPFCYIFKNASKKSVVLV